MKQNLYLRIVLFTTLLVSMLTSCLEYNLPDLPLYEGNEITLVNVEHRYNGNQVMNGKPVVAYQKLNVSQQINSESGIIDIRITVPEPVGQFTTEEKDKVVQTNLWLYLNISTAATIKPINGTPELGDPTDATKPLKFEVIAANGSKKTWTINVIQFNK